MTINLVCDLDCELVDSCLEVLRMIMTWLTGCFMPPFNQWDQVVLHPCGPLILLPSGHAHFISASSAANAAAACNATTAGATSSAATAAASHGHLWCWKPGIHARLYLTPTHPQPAGVPVWLCTVFRLHSLWLSLRRAQSFGRGRHSWWPLRWHPWHHCSQATRSPSHHCCCRKRAL